MKTVGYNFIHWGSLDACMSIYRYRSSGTEISQLSLSRVHGHM
jgi:hypothetical protein